MFGRMRAEKDLEPEQRRGPVVLLAGQLSERGQLDQAENFTQVDPHESE